MRRTIQGLAEAGDQLIQQSIDATRKYYEAEVRGASPQELQRLKVIADSLYNAVCDYQLKSQGELGDTYH